MVAPVVSPLNHHIVYTDIEELRNRKLTPEEVKQGLAALERAIQRGTEISVRYSNTGAPETWEIINAMRDERTRELG